MDIPRGTELLVWYNDSYTSFFGIPLQCIAQDENCKSYPSKSHLFTQLAVCFPLSTTAKSVIFKGVSFVFHVLFIDQTTYGKPTYICGC